MARALSSQKVFHQLTGVFRLDDSGVNSLTVSPVQAKGTKTIDVTPAEGSMFTAGDEIRIGPNGNTAEVNVVESISTDELTLRLPLTRQVEIGEVITVLSAVDLGATDENGVNIETTMGETPIIAGTQKKTYLFINQNLEEQLTWALRDFDPENIAASLGLDELSSGIVDVNGVSLPLDDVITQTNQPWKFEGLLEDATAVTAFVFSAKVASANQSLQFAEGQATIISFTLRSNGNRSFLLI